MNRRSFFGAIAAAFAGVKAKVWKPVQPRPTLTINQLVGGFVPRMKIGDTITVRKPPRFFVRESEQEILSLARSRFTATIKSHDAQMADLRSDFKFFSGPARPFVEPSGDIPMASSCECEDYED